MFAAFVCIGRAGEYPCNNIDLLSFISLRDLGSANGANGNDIWGWEDPYVVLNFMCVQQGDVKFRLILTVHR